MDVKAHRIVGVGEAPPAGVRASLGRVLGLVPVWPIDAEGNERCWRFVPESMKKLIDEVLAKLRIEAGFC